MKKTILQKTLSLLLTLLLLLGAAPLALAQEEPQKINLFEYFQGSDLDLTPYRGKALFLNFFTEWCPYCMEEMGAIKQIFDEYSPDELQIILVHPWSGEDASNTENVKARFGMEEMTFFEDETMAVTSLVGVQGFPTSVFADKDGYVTQVTYGLTYDQMNVIMVGMDVAPKGEATPQATPEATPESAL